MMNAVNSTFRENDLVEINGEDYIVGRIVETDFTVRMRLDKKRAPSMTIAFRKNTE